MLVALAVACVATACAGNPPGREHPMDKRLSHVFVQRSCTQEDAPALEIYLTHDAYSGEGEPSPPYLRLEISSPANEVLDTPVSVRLLMGRRDPAKPGRIARAQLVEKGQPPVWLSGTVSLTTLRQDWVEGQFEVDMPAGKPWRTRFKAAYRKQASVCG
jgi:hypothetical protein